VRSYTHLLCYILFPFNDLAPTEIYTLSLHDALPILKKFFKLLAGISKQHRRTCTGWIVANWPANICPTFPSSNCPQYGNPLISMTNMPIAILSNRQHKSFLNLPDSMRQPAWKSYGASFMTSQISC